MALSIAIHCLPCLVHCRGAKEALSHGRWRVHINKEGRVCGRRAFLRRRLAEPAAGPHLFGPWRPPSAAG